MSIAIAHFLRKFLPFRFRRVPPRSRAPGGTGSRTARGRRRRAQAAHHGSPARQ